MSVMTGLWWTFLCSELGCDRAACLQEPAEGKQDFLAFLEDVSNAAWRLLQPPVTD